MAGARVTGGRGSGVGTRRRGGLLCACALSVRGLPDAIDYLVVDAYGSLRPRECRVAVQPTPIHSTHGPRQIVVPVPLGEGQIAGRLLAVAQERCPTETGVLAPGLPQHPPLLLPLRLVSRHDIHADH